MAQSEKMTGWKSKIPILLRKRLGKQQLDALVEQAKAAKHTTRSKNETRER